MGYVSEVEYLLLNSVVMEDVFEKVMFELRLEMMRVFNHISVLGRTFQTEGMAGTKALEG